MYSLVDVINDICVFEDAYMCIDDIDFDKMLPKKMNEFIPKDKYGCTVLYSECFSKGEHFIASSSADFTKRVRQYLHDYMMLMPPILEQPEKDLVSVYVVDKNGTSRLVMQNIKIDFTEEAMHFIMSLGEFAYIVHRDLSVNLFHKVIH